MAEDIIVRDRSPLTGNPGSVVFDMPYGDARMHAFLTAYYRDAAGGQSIDLSRLPTSYTILRDARDGFCWQREILGPSGMATLYDRWIDPAASLRKRIDAGLAYHGGVVDAVRKAIAFTSATPGSLHFLDVGMGWGNFVLAAKALGVRRAAGVELSQARIEEGRRHGIEMLATTEVIPPESVDVLFSNHVLEHVSDPLLELKEYRRLLKPNGILRLALPTLRGRAGPHWVGKSVLQPLEHINAFPVRALRWLLGEVGFRVLPHLPALVRNDFYARRG